MQVSWSTCSCACWPFTVKWLMPNHDHGNSSPATPHLVCSRIWAWSDFAEEKRIKDVKVKWRNEEMKLKHVPKHVPQPFWKTLRLEHFKTLPRPLKIDIATLKPWKISEKAIELRVVVEAFSSLQDPIAFGLLDQPVLAVPGRLNAIDMFFFQKTSLWMLRGRPQCVPSPSVLPVARDRKSVV